jgi:membrane fusion protein, heavy metal efflux system
MRAFVLLLVACGSPAVEVPEAIEPTADTVTLSADAIAHGGIRLGVAERRALGGGAAIPAEIDFEATAVAHVGALAAGRFQTVAVALGDRVTRGQTLATIASVDVASARARLGQTQARLEAARQSLARQQQLQEEGVGARRALIEAQAEVAQLEAEHEGLRRELGVFGSGRGGELSLISPMDGVVIELNATVGETASGTEPSFVVVDPTRIWVRGAVPELQIGSVQEGAAVTVRVHAFPELALDGTITYVAPALSESTRSLTIRVTLSRFEPRLRRGLYGTIELREAGEDDRPIVVPMDAISIIDGQDVVFVPERGAGVFRAQSVELGRRAGSWVAVRSGLAEGAAIVVEGSFTLKSALRQHEIETEHEE